MMVTATASLLISYRLLKRWPIMPVVTAVMVLVFGEVDAVAAGPDLPPDQAYGRSI